MQGNDKPTSNRFTGSHSTGVNTMHHKSLITLGGLATALLAHASPPQEKVVCTDAPRSTWMTQQQAHKVFQAERYLLVKFKVSRGNCHEFYAVDALGTVVEAYLHPVTGETVRLTRLPAPATDAHTTGLQTPARP